MDARQNCGLTLGAQLQISVVIYGSGIVEGCTKRPQSRDIRIRHGHPKKRDFVIGGRPVLQRGVHDDRQPERYKIVLA
jgi:hypothetical protein